MLTRKAAGANFSVFDLNRPRDRTLYPPGHRGSSYCVWKKNERIQL